LSGKPDRGDKQATGSGGERGKGPAGSFLLPFFLFGGLFLPVIFFFLAAFFLPPPCFFLAAGSLATRSASSETACSKLSSSIEVPFVSEALVSPSVT
jgi:hypothetical protein